jgi:hypothetical protein
VAKYLTLGKAKAQRLMLRNAAAAAVTKGVLTVRKAAAQALPTMSVFTATSARS